MAWFILIIAGGFEAFSVAMLNQIQISRHKWIPITLFSLAFGTSLVLLSISMQSISMGTAYAIWTGIGVVGGTLIGMFLYGESKNVKRIFYISIVLASAIGLKLVS
ncbi:DMT family transporter [Pallidibacillus pasinlerensis]|uniref:Multidrug efflux SMR transporter n=1 Tax=Pallidibacillus pasinlerensis TaxID=2703818 RepID=A0ABX0A4L3_9BACI|nr:multidrug efflux SMR transporter [Pallidibacillus pasinlerensis]NCU18376.1 multidrug efflux SMR transporter [Pallidibacillus pasinlerensis]